MIQLFSRWPLRRSSSYQVAIAVYPQRVHIAIISQDGQPALVVNDDIEVTNEKFASSIQLLLERYQRLIKPSTPVQVVLSARLVNQTTIERPALPENELVQGLPWAVKDLIDLSPADMLVDYYEPIIDQPGRRKLHIVAVSRHWLQNLIAPLHKAKLDIQGVINEDVALLALLPAQHVPQILLTSTNSGDTELLLVKDKALIVSRQLKSTQLPSGHQDDIDIDALAIELQRSMDYFSGQLRQAPLQEIWLALPGSRVTELCEQLSNNLSVRVERLVYPGWAAELGAGDYSDIGALAGLVLLDSSLNDFRKQETA